MSHPLDGCWAKIERANENIDSLRREILAFIGSSDYRIVRDVDAEAREYTFRAFGPDDPIPLRFSVLAGEIIHHLRSSLDHLIWALVLARHRTPTFKVQFAICATDTEYAKAKRQGIIKGVSASAQALIEESQPYFKSTARYPDPPNHPLGILGNLNITDKHRLLVVVSLYVAGANSITFAAPAAIAHSRYVKFEPRVWGKGFFVHPTKDGTQVLRVTLLPGMPEGVDVQANFPIEIAFRKFGTSMSELIISGLETLRDAVRNTIRRFASEF